MRNQITVRLKVSDLRKKLNIKDGINGLDGKDAIVDYVKIRKDLEELVSKIPLAQNGKDVSPETLDQLQKDIEELKKKPETRVIGGGMSVGSLKYFFKHNIIPTGTINGTNKVFILPDNPTPNTLKVFADGARQTITTDYTISGNTITFILAPTSSVLCDYQV